MLFGRKIANATHMGGTQHVRVAVGIMGNAASLLLYAAPILTFLAVVRKRSTQEFSCVPYIIALMNCLLYTWYGLPVVSHKWENLPLVTINGLGIILETSFVIIYLCFAPPDRKKLVSMLLVPVAVVFSVTALVSSFAFGGYKHRKAFVGSVGLVASVGMYSSPLVAMRTVIQTRSVEFMPFHLSFFSFVASTLWMAYGLLGHDLFLASPNLLGSPLGLLQLVLYVLYRKGKCKGVTEVPNETPDLEKNGIAREEPSANGHHITIAGASSRTSVS